MSDAPERIWALPDFLGGTERAYTSPFGRAVEYVRADRIAELEAEVARLREALEQVGYKTYE